MQVGDLVKTELWGPGVIIQSRDRMGSVEVLVSTDAGGPRPKVRRIHQRHLEVISESR